MTVKAAKNKKLIELLIGTNIFIQNISNIKNLMIYKFLLAMNDDQDIYKNKYIIFAKLYSALLILPFLVIINFTETIQYWNDQTRFENIFNLTNVIILLILISNLIDTLIQLEDLKNKQNLKQKIVISQILLFIQHIMNINQQIHQILFYPQTQNQAITIDILQIILHSLLQISNYPKILTLIIIEIFWIQYSIFYSDSFQLYVQIQFHQFTLQIIITTCIEQYFQIHSLRESYDRIHSVATIMHDLRNYVQSLIGENLIMNNVNQLKNDNFQKDNEEKLIKKFIQYRICYIYHIELIYDKNYVIKNEQINSDSIISLIAYSMKSIFMYKNCYIQIIQKSKIEVINFDITIFDQLICNITKYLYDNGIDRITINIEIIEIKKFYQINVEFKIENGESNNNYDLLFNSLKNTNEFHLLLTSLKIGTIQNLNKNENRINQEIQIYNENWQETMNSVEMNPFDKKNIEEIQYESMIDDQQFEQQIEIKIRDKKLRKNSFIDTESIKSLSKSQSRSLSGSLNIESIKFEKSPSNDQTKVDNDKISKEESIINLNNSIPIKIDPFSITPITSLNQDLDKLVQKVDLNFIFINVDDEESILRMNSKVLKKDGKTLNTCIDRESYFILLTKIQLDICAGNVLKNIQLVVFMDHMVDCDTGWKIIEKANEINKSYGLIVRQILLSSTEGVDTIDLQSKRDVKDFVTKPLTKPKFQTLLKKL